MKNSSCRSPLSSSARGKNIHIHSIHLRLLCMILLMDIAPYRQGRELIGASGASCSGQCLNAAVLDKGKNALSSPARHEPHVIQSDNYLAAEGGNRLRLVGIRQ